MQHVLKACDVTTAHGLTVYQTLIEPDNKNLFLEVIERLELGEWCYTNVQNNFDF